jgi:tetratricopeptide (TPR) repeat protein
MSITFFITDTGEFYADMEAISLDEETYRWLSHNRIDMGRKSSFTVARESPVFNTLPEAEAWLTSKWFPDANWGEDPWDIDPEIGPTEEHYKECARVAHEINELAAVERLAEILPLESNHSYICRVGVWYWSIEHRRLAAMAYRRSIELQPEADTYFNLAVCHDDLEEFDEAAQAMTHFYELVSSAEERENSEAMLRQHGKAHLVE